MVKAIVLRVEGTNCDLEMAHALKLAGAEPRLIHINQLLSGDVHLETFQLLALPGGFAHGDDISAGKIFATILMHRLGKQVKKFVDAGKPVIGVCNGFQVLVKAGILPGFNWGVQEATLAANDCGSFVDRWVHLKTAEAGGKSVFSKGLKESIFLPIAHGEGKFMAGREILDKIVENGQVVFTYLPGENPNGSLSDIAGICNPAGNVLGMMPHPERFLTKYTHPHWTASPELPEEGDGLAIFKNAVEHAKKF